MTPKSAVLSALEQARRVLIVMHASPDGDSAGSAVALGLALRRLGRSVTWVVADQVPARLGFLPEIASVRTWNKVALDDFDTVVAVDCGAASRMGAPEALWTHCSLHHIPLINIDHHSKNPQFGTINWVESHMSSTGEMVGELIREAGWGITADEAVGLYTAISTDTLSFRQVNTAPQTLDTVHWLVQESGMDLADVNRKIWDSRSACELRFLGWAFGHVTFSADGRFAWLRVPRTAMEEYAVDDAGVDTVVHHLMSVESVEVAFLARESADGQHVKVSWRGRSPWNAAELAARFGGGGHEYAGAAVVTGVLDEVAEAVRRELAPEADE